MNSKRHQGKLEPVDKHMNTVYTKTMHSYLIHHLSSYVTSHPSQLSLAIPPWVDTMSNSQTAVMFCGWGVKAGMARVW